MQPQTTYVLYDYLQVAGGAERTTLAIAAGLPGGIAVTSRVFSEASPLLGGGCIAHLGTRLTKLLGRIPEAIYCFVWRTSFLEHADLVVYSGFYAPFAVIHQRRGRSVYYCHTVPRFAYDQYSNYRDSMSAPKRWLFDLFVRWIRKRYKAALQSMDVIVANSDNVRSRLASFLEVKALVIPPPIDVRRYVWLSDGDYYVSLARLVPLKRVEIIVRAFLKMPERKLVVASGGPELDRIKALAATANNISFTGWQSDDDLVKLIGNARAAIYIPVDEDFGMSPVEAMAAGKPVIGVAEGGLLETVIPGRTGILIEGAPTPEKLITAVEQIEEIGPHTYRDVCMRHASEFSVEVFLTRLRVVTMSRDNSGV